MVRGPDANVLRYRWHTRAAGALFWVPTIVLYFIDQVGLARALQVQALYYASVVLFEVPSGWFSDRVGRVTTLRFTATAWIVAFACFLAGGLGPIIAGQVLLALGYASLSGTDVTFLYETLDADGRGSSFEAEEARAREGSLYLSASSALAGGLLGLIDLRLPFLAALLVAVAQFAIVSRMDEPPRAAVAAAGWRRDAAAVVGHIRSRALAWVALYVVAEIVLIHLASELASPYAAEALDRPVDDPAGAAVIAGVLVAAAALTGAAALRLYARVRDRISTLGVLVGACFVSAVIVVVMAAGFVVWVLPVVALRGVQASVTTVAVPAVVGRRVESQRRATTLSVMSLLGRGSYAGVLLLISLVAGEELAQALDVAAVIAVATAVTVAAAAFVTRPDLDRSVG